MQQQKMIKKVKKAASKEFLANEQIGSAQMTNFVG